MFVLLKELKERIREELKAKGKTRDINQVSLMHTTIAKWVDYNQIQELSTYFNGETPNTFPNRVIALAALI
jgi:hypothetical protein